MANALYANHVPQHDEVDDRLDAARALLGVSPNSVADSQAPIALFGRPVEKSSPEPPKDEPTIARRPRSDSAGLEALAFLATKEQANMATDKVVVESSTRPLVASAISSSSSDDDSDAMPPPPPRTGAPACPRTRRPSDGT